MDDGCSAPTHFDDKGIDARCYFPNSANGVQAMMGVPHIADNDGYLIGLPRNAFRYSMETACSGIYLVLPSQLKWNV
jgi:hypothetical protein